MTFSPSRDKESWPNLDCLRWAAHMLSAASSLPSRFLERDKL